MRRAKSRPTGSFVLIARAKALAKLAMRWAATHGHGQRRALPLLRAGEAAIQFRARGLDTFHGLEWAGLLTADGGPELESRSEHVILRWMLLQHC